MIPVFELWLVCFILFEMDGHGEAFPERWVANACHGRVLGWEPCVCKCCRCGVVVLLAIKQVETAVAFNQNTVALISYCRLVVNNPEVAGFSKRSAAECGLWCWNF